MGDAKHYASFLFTQAQLEANSIVMMMIVAPAISRSGQRLRHRRGLRWWLGRRRGNRRKIEERKRGKKIGNQSRPVPQVPHDKICWVDWAGEEVICGVGGCATGGAQTAPAPFQQRQKTVEGRAVHGTQLGERRSMGTRERRFLYCHRRRTLS